MIVSISVKSPILLRQLVLAHIFLSLYFYLICESREVTSWINFEFVYSFTRADSEICHIKDPVYHLVTFRRSFQSCVKRV